MSDQEFMAAFENCTLSTQNFHHTDHVRMGFLYMSQFPVLEALQRFTHALQRFARSVGKPNLYHETITWAFLFLIHQRLVMHSSQHDGRRPSWNEFAPENPELLNRKARVILRDYYFDETLESELAKKIFVLPNRMVSPEGSCGCRRHP